MWGETWPAHIPARYWCAGTYGDQMVGVARLFGLARGSGAGNCVCRKPGFGNPWSLIHRVCRHPEMSSDPREASRTRAAPTCSRPLDKTTRSRGTRTTARRPKDGRLERSRLRPPGRSTGVCTGLDHMQRSDLWSVLRRPILNSEVWNSQATPGGGCATRRHPSHCVAGTARARADRWELEHRRTILDLKSSFYQHVTHAGPLKLLQHLRAYISVYIDTAVQITEIRTLGRNIERVLSLT
jgi:hypothetical protein